MDWAKLGGLGEMDWARLGVLGGMDWAILGVLGVGWGVLGHTGLWRLAREERGQTGAGGTGPSRGCGRLYWSGLG